MSWFALCRVRGCRQLGDRPSRRAARSGPRGLGRRRRLRLLVGQARDVGSADGAAPRGGSAVASSSWPATDAGAAGEALGSLGRARNARPRPGGGAGRAAGAGGDGAGEATALEARARLEPAPPEWFEAKSPGLPREATTGAGRAAGGSVDAATVAANAAAETCACAATGSFRPPDAGVAAARLVSRTGASARLICNSTKHVVRTTDHDEVFDIVPPDQHELSLAVETERIDETEPRLARPPAAGTLNRCANTSR